MARSPSRTSQATMTAALRPLVARRRRSRARRSSPRGSSDSARPPRPQLLLESARRSYIATISSCSRCRPSAVTTKCAREMNSVGRMSRRPRANSSTASSAIVLTGTLERAPAGPRIGSFSKRLVVDVERRDRAVVRLDRAASSRLLDRAEQPGIGERAHVVADPADGLLKTLGELLRADRAVDRLAKMRCAGRMREGPDDSRVAQQLEPAAGLDPRGSTPRRQPRASARTARSTSWSPANASNVRPIVSGTSRQAARTAATSSRGIGPRLPRSVER